MRPLGKFAPLIDRHRGSLVRIGWVMGSGLASRAAQLAVMTIVARRLGPTDYGQFIFAIGTATVAGMLGNLGWQFSFNRFFAVARRRDDESELLGLMRASNRVNLLGALTAAAVLAVAGLMAQELAFGLLAAAILTIPMAITLLRRQQLAGTGQSAVALVLDQGFASIVLLVAVLSAQLTLTEMLAIYAVALAAGNIGASLLVRRKLPVALRQVKPRYELATWLRVSLNLMQARLARILLSRIDVLLLPVLASLAAAGIYGAAFRATYFMAFSQFVLQTVNGPQFAEAFAAGQIARVRRILKLSLVFSLATSLPWLALFVVFPGTVMRVLFGADYADGAWPLVLIAIGQFAFCLCGPFNALLANGGREREMVRLSYAVLVGSLALSFALIPSLEAVGAAIVVLCSSAALLVGQAWLSRDVLGASTDRDGAEAKKTGPESDS